MGLIKLPTFLKWWFSIATWKREYCFWKREQGTFGYKIANILPMNVEVVLSAGLQTCKISTAIVLDGLIPIFQLANPIFRLAMPMIIMIWLVGQPTFLLARCIHHKMTPVIHDFTESPMASASILARFMAASASLGNASRSSKCSELRTWGQLAPPKSPNKWMVFTRV